MNKVHIQRAYISIVQTNTHVLKERNQKHDRTESTTVWLQTRWEDFSCDSEAFWGSNHVRHVAQLQIFQSTAIIAAF